MSGPKRGENGDNPYLQHLHPSQRGSASTSTRDPLEGLVPRFVTAEQARRILVSQVSGVSITFLVCSL